MNQIAKEKYKLFCQQTYVPIFSKPWWLDAICGPDNWGVWLYEKGENILAALPYYTERRDKYWYITKALLTQNNGLIIYYPPEQKICKRQEYEEEIIKAAVKFIVSLNMDVYEQQYHYEFSNFLPFFWEDFAVIPRVTYVIEDTSDMQRIIDNFSSNYKNKIRKGERNIACFRSVPWDIFYEEHEKIFKRQGLQCPFTFKQWQKLWEVCAEENAGDIIAACSGDGTILSLAFLAKDEKSEYLLLGGNIPEHASMQTYTALVKKCIQIASERGLKFDFEGSMIQRINHSFREYGGTPKLYYRIRKVFNPDIIRAEAEERIRQLGG